MSLFQENLNAIKQAIGYFNSLSAQDKALIVSDLNQIRTNEQVFDRLSPLFEAIQNDISRYDETTLSQKLFELGLEETFAKLLVNNMIKQAPTIEYEIRVLSKMDDEEFKKLVPALMQDVWVKQNLKPDTIQQFGLTTQFYDVFVNFSRNMMNNLARRIQTDEKLEKVCLENGLSKPKLETLLNVAKVNSKFWHDLLVFTNAQDSVFEIRAVRQQNNAILQTLREILQLIKENKEPSETRHFQ